MNFLNGVRRSLFVFLLFFSVAVNAVNSPDYLGYSKDATVKVFINWDSFEDNGISASWKRPFQDIVINSYTRWMHVAGFRLTPKFWGYTDRTSPSANEIIIMMNEMHAGPCASASGCDDRLASRFGQPATIVFHRKSRVTGAAWNFVPYRPNNSSELDMMSILMHEMGHAFGLQHNTDGADRSVMGFYNFAGRYGPFRDDIADIRAQYGVKTNRRFSIKRSTNSAASWSNWSTNLTGLAVTTSMDPTATRDPDRTILYYTHQNKKPAFIHGNNSGSSFDAAKWWIYGGERSVYGTAGHGYGNEYMMAWVDDFDNNRIKVVFSSNGGVNYSWRNPASDARTYGTPAIHKVSNNKWILAYSLYDRADMARNGKIVARVSSNDGVTWGPEIVLSNFYRAVSGVSIASNNENEVRIGFAWDFRTTGANLLKRTIRAHLSGDNLIYDGMIYESEATRTQPVFTKNSQRFLQAWREPNFLTSINTRFSGEGSTQWTNYVRAVESTPVTPSIAAYKGWSYSFLYSLGD